MFVVVRCCLLGACCLLYDEVAAWYLLFVCVLFVVGCRSWFFGLLFVGCLLLFFVCWLHFVVCVRCLTSAVCCLKIVDCSGLPCS